LHRRSYNRAKHRSSAEDRALSQSTYRDTLSRGLISYLGISRNPLEDLLQGFPTMAGLPARLYHHGLAHQ
jgi:hypothetical protein